MAKKICRAFRACQLQEDRTAIGLDVELEAQETSKSSAVVGGRRCTELRSALFITPILLTATLSPWRWTALDRLSAGSYVTGMRRRDRRPTAGRCAPAIRGSPPWPRAGLLCRNVSFFTATQPYVAVKTGILRQFRLLHRHLGRSTATSTCPPQFTAILPQLNLLYRNINVSTARYCNFAATLPSSPQLHLIHRTSRFFAAT